MATAAAAAGAAHASQRKVFVRVHNDPRADAISALEDGQLPPSRPAAHEPFSRWLEKMLRELIHARHSPLFKVGLGLMAAFLVGILLVHMLLYGRWTHNSASQGHFHGHGRIPNAETDVHHPSHPHGESSSAVNVTDQELAWHMIAKKATEHWEGKDGGSALLQKMSCERAVMMKQNLQWSGFATPFLWVIAGIAAGLERGVPLFLKPFEKHSEWMYDCGTGESWRCYSERITETCLRAADSDKESTAASERVLVPIDRIVHQFDGVRCRNIAMVFRTDPLPENSELPMCYYLPSEFINLHFKYEVPLPDSLAQFRLIAQAAWTRLKPKVVADVDELVKQQLDTLGSDFIGFDLRVESDHIGWHGGASDLEPFLEVALYLSNASTVFVACKSKKVVESLESVAGSRSGLRFVAIVYSPTYSIQQLQARDALSLNHVAFVHAAAEAEIMRRAPLVVGRFTSSFSRLVQMLRSQPPQTFISLDDAWQVLDSRDNQEPIPYCSAPFAHAIYCSTLAPGGNELDARRDRATQLELSKT
ncbi:hypothetical protein FVE85_0604 [Porphyridium purpureum]|uniref:Uncharacterized protein n=1 Tax=Porphyridium purpureum TaxID=35688 RepID=A0A5J4Z0D8_PORPP|nr:hypothetical protein FVE85_0604 [Porphyridium purpureum]|eukprot:POR3801..scf208_2